MVWTKDGGIIKVFIKHFVSHTLKTNQKKKSLHFNLKYQK